MREESLEATNAPKYIIPSFCEACGACEKWPYFYL